MTTMKDRIVQYGRNALKVCLLLAVLPLMLGHNNEKKLDNCDDTASCPSFHSYALTGSGTSHTDAISIVGTLSIYINGSDTPTKTINGTGTSIDAQSFALIDKTLTSIRLKIDSPSQVGQLGEVWLWDGDSGKYLKLTAALSVKSTGVFLDLTFPITVTDFAESSTGTIPAVDEITYKLAGNNIGSGNLETGINVSIKLNDVSILTDPSPIGSNAAFTFAAATLGELHIQINYDAGKLQTSEFWVFDATGHGTKLLHRLDSTDAGFKLDNTYILP